MEPIKFKIPREGASVGREVGVTLTGTVPKGRYLWIFVFSSGAYYAEGKPGPLPPDYWFLAGVTLGGSGAGDINAPYTIYAVIADAQANAKITKAFDRNNGNTGTRAIPGGAGAKKVTHVTVVRTH